MQGPRFDGALSKALQGKEEGLREEPFFRSESRKGSVRSPSFVGGEVPYGARQTASKGAEKSA